MVDEVFDFVQCFLACGWAQLAFPHSHHFPTHSSQFGFVAFVATAVAAYFFFPKFHVGVRYMAIDAVSVKKTAMYENDYAVAAQHYVGSPRQSLYIFQVSVSS